MAHKEHFRRWMPRGGSNPSKVEQRLKEALTAINPISSVKIFSQEEIAEYEKELKDRDSKLRKS